MDANANVEFFAFSFIFLSFFLITPLFLQLFSLLVYLSVQCSLLGVRQIAALDDFFVYYMVRKEGDCTCVAERRLWLRNRRWMHQEDRNGKNNP